MRVDNGKANGANEALMIIVLDVMVSMGILVTLGQTEVDHV
jgi:hypothetical protein